MITEIAVLKIDPTQTKQFDKMHGEVVNFLRRQSGYISDKLMLAQEVPGQYVLMVEWESIDAHQKFIDSADYALMSGPYGKFVKDSSFAHYLTVNAS